MSELLEKEQNQETFGWAARDPSGILSPFHFHRRTNGDFDVTIKILYCGICHSDLHVVRNEFGISLYPVVPGHEIVGVVTQVGDKVQKFKLGDKAGVGCFVDSCGKCKHCKENLENYCPKAITTYTTAMFNGDTNKNYGGFSDIYVVNEHFVVQIPDTLPLEGAVPLLCAGITVFSPMKYFGLDKPGMHVGVVGLGGLGHVAVKFAKAFGMKVTVISTSERKREEAIQHLKADHFILSHDSEQMQASVGELDGILDTVSAAHPLMPLVDLLNTDGKLILLSASSLDKPVEVNVVPLLVVKMMQGGRGLEEVQEEE
ncbi:probable mannitol dehydrogenase isoform X3 [Tripterygium wilfordii]|uniref:probable mannitol dehydrogenase isoform X3 n=1 Tax=Tripterygium wilfordii TaxID=458696 RepID=UPI0018F80DF5|nr:probable mannitol dehydrogenase isoform X3 [Tripterygium wilfordii]